MPRPVLACFVLALLAIVALCWMFRYTTVEMPTSAVLFRVDRWTGEVCTVVANQREMVCARR